MPQYGNVVGALQAGTAAGDAIVRTNIEQRRLQLERERMARAQAIQDIELQLKMMSLARPVNAAGAVEEQITPPDIGGIPGAMRDPLLTLRQPDKSRLVKMPNGSQFELMSTEERRQRQLDFDSKRQRIESEGKLEATRRAFEVMNPLQRQAAIDRAKAEGDIKSAHAMDLLRQQIDLGQDPASRQRQQQWFQSQEGEKNRKFQAGEHAKDRSSRELINREDNAAADRRSERAATREATAGQNLVQQRFLENEQDQIDSFQQEADELRSSARKIREGINSGKLFDVTETDRGYRVSESKRTPKKSMMGFGSVTAEQKAEVESQASALEERAKALDRRIKLKKVRMTSSSGGGGRATTPDALYERYGLSR